MHQGNPSARRSDEPAARCRQADALTRSAFAVYEQIVEIAEHPVDDREMWLLIPSHSALKMAIDWLDQIFYELETHGRYDGLKRRPPLRLTA